MSRQRFSSQCVLESKKSKNCKTDRILSGNRSSPGGNSFPVSTLQSLARSPNSHRDLTPVAYPSTGSTACVNGKLERSPEPSVDLHKVRLPFSTNFELNHGHAVPGYMVQNGSCHLPSLGVLLNTFAEDADSTRWRIFTQPPVCEGGDRLSLVVQREDSVRVPRDIFLKQERAASKVLILLHCSFQLAHGFGVLHGRGRTMSIRPDHRTIGLQHDRKLAAANSICRLSRRTLEIRRKAIGSP